MNMLSPAQISDEVSSSSHHKTTMPLISVLLMSMAASGAIAMGDIFGLMQQ